MPCSDLYENEYSDCVLEYNDSQSVLWIGRICEVKRPDRPLDLAEVCPDLRFDLVGLAGGILSLFKSPDERRKMSRRIRQFYFKNYTVDTVMAKFEKAFIDVNRKSISGGSEMSQS